MMFIINGLIVNLTAAAAFPFRPKETGVCAHAGPDYLFRDFAFGILPGGGGSGLPHHDWEACPYETCG
jgi:hypothetical protein